MWEALMIAGLVAAFLAVAGVAGLTVYRLWTASGEGAPGPSGGGSSSPAADQREP